VTCCVELGKILGVLVGAREHLVVVLPGIGGSVLALPGRPDELVWSGGLRNAGHVLRHPKALSVEERPRLSPVGLISTRKVFGVWTAIPGYDGLLRKLASLPGAVLDDGTGPMNLDANVVAVGYDFRLGVADAAEQLQRQVQPRLAHLWPDVDDRRRRLLIVAHSMGGLVARFWLGAEDNWPLCRALMTLATPHRGAPKALDVLANGVAVKGLHLITKPVPVLRGWQSMYELLPRYAAVWDESARDPDRTRLMYPHELPLPWLAGPARRAHRMHAGIHDAWEAIPRTGPHVDPRIGYGHGTLRRSVWDGRRVTVTSGALGGPAVGRWDADLGDGTVPAYSGLPIEMDAAPPGGFRVPLRHGPIADLGEVAAWAESFEPWPAFVPIQGEERPVVLGLDVDQVVLAQQPVRVAASVVGTDVPAQGAAVAAIIVALDNPAVHHPAVRLEWGGPDGAFHGELPGLDPGTYELRILAEEVPHAGDLQTQETLEVLDDDVLD